MALTRLDATARRGACALLASLVTLATLAACGGGDTVAPIAVARVTLTGVADTITVGDRRALAAQVLDAKGVAITGRHVTWTTGNATVATVDTLGQLTAVAPGSTTVSATADGVSGTAPIVVRRTAVARVSVGGRAADTLWLTRSHTLSAQTFGPTGESLPDRAVSWVSLDTSIAAITPAGNGTISVRGGRLGTTKLIARSEGIDTTITVSVVPIPIARLTLVGPDSVYIGKTVTVTAQAWAPDGVPLVHTDLAGRVVAWGSTDFNTITAEGVADEDAHTYSGLSALVKGWKGGNATVTATVDGVSARYTLITARAPIVAMRFFPGTVTMQVGETTTLAAAPMDLDSLYLQNISLTYGVASGANVLKLTQTTAGGLAVARIQALSAGAASVSVTAEGKTFTIPVTVRPAVTPVRVYPSTITAAPGATGRVLVIATDSSGTSVTPTGITYRSSNAGVVTVDATGRVTMVAAGTATVTATSAAGASATTAVTVQNATTSTYHIDVRPAGTVPPEIMAAAQKAAARWERVISAELPPTEVSLTPGACISGVGAVNIVTTGLVVYVSAEKIDGSRNILAYAGPCVTRANNQGGLPSVGTMTIDIDDIPLLTGSSSDLAADVIAHELGHVLGIGTLWGGVAGNPGLLHYHSGDIRFDGPAAAEAAVRLGMETSTSAGVAVEDAGGLGTAGGHWRERTYLGELMTGYVGTAPNPLSAVSVASLKDLGYPVTELGADIVSPTTIAGGAAFSALAAPLGGPSLSRTPLATPLFQIGERLRQPKFTTDRHGKTQAKQ